MVNNGTPSRGCDACRESHTRCDGTTPECARCKRLKKKCKYRNHIDALFRNQPGTTSATYEQKANPAFNGSFLATTKAKVSHDLLRSRPGSGMSRSLLPLQEDLAICYFYEKVLETVSVGDHARYLHLQLPALFSRSKQDSALHLASQAISHAAWARYRGNKENAVEISRRRYVESISALRSAIRDPVEVKSDETLYTILLLSGYETISFSLDASSSWSSHINGASSLLRMRGREHMSTPFSCNMFLFIRRNTIHNHIQLSRPVDPIFDEFADIVSPYENAEDRLLSIIIKIPAIQYRANDILSRCCMIENDIYELIEAAESLDLELIQWAETVPTAWTFSISSNLSSPFDPEFSSANFLPNHLHRYSEFYTARVWNLYRVARLIIQSILLRTATCSESISADNIDKPHIEKLNRILVNDICASVPFLLGFDTSDLKRSLVPRHGEHLWPQNVMPKQSSNAAHTGRFSLIWPLHVSSTASSIPKFQRQWMRAQLHWIAEFEPQAKLVSDAQSQTLFGGPEDICFDYA